MVAYPTEYLYFITFHNLLQCINLFTPDKSFLTNIHGSGEEIVIILSSLAEEEYTPTLTRTCRTCGRDYTDIECPYCRASRMRLRGRP